MTKITQNSFLGGQLDYELMGRQDFDRYAKGASKLVNFNLMKRGGISKRMGFDRLVDLDALGIPSNAKVRLVPFAYSKSHGFVLVFSPGTCHAVCTVEGAQYYAWEIPYGDAFTTDEQLASFDYQQCGYKLYIAHQKHHPSVIYTSADEVDTAIASAQAGGAPQSPFRWTKFNVNKTGAGIPIIDKFTLTRIAASNENAAGIVTERYRVSAVYDDNETAACPEAYKENALSSPGTLTQTSITGDVRATTVQSGPRSVTDTPATTSKTTSNNKSESVEGTRYYAPWTESQVIKIKINVPSRKVGAATQYPEQLRVYRKSKGYYGLIGVVKVDAEETNATISFEAHGLTKTVERYETVGSNSSTPAYVSSLPDNGGDYSNKSKVVIAEGRDFNAESSLKITESTNRALNADTMSMTLWLGAATSVNTEWTSNDKTKPTKQMVTVYASTAKKILMSATGTYVDEGGNEVAFSTGDIEVDIPNYADVREKSVVMSITGNNASTRKTSIENNIKAALGELGQGYVQIKASDVFGDYMTGSFVKIGSVTIKPYASDEMLVLRGVAIADGIMPETVTFEDNNIVPDSSITPYEDEEEDPFSRAKDYPACVCLSRQRLIWASSRANPERVWMSEVGDFTVYTAHEVQKNDDAIEFDLPVTRFAKLNHIVEMKSLIAFNSACEWLIDSASSVQGITYETVQARPQSYIGSNERVKPIVCGNGVLFCDRTGQSVRRFAYNIQDDGFAGTDVSALSCSIFATNNIVDWTYQQFPNDTVWCVLADGTMASLTIMPEQQIVAWGTHRHCVPGTRITAISTSFAVSPSLAEIRDGEDTERAYELATHQEVFAVTEDADGNRWLERMRVGCDAEDSVYNAITLDSMRVVTSSDAYNASTNPGGMMQGEQYRYYSAKSGEEMSRTEAEEAVGEDTPVFEGCPVECKFTSVYPIVGRDVGVGQFDVKDIVNVGLRLMASSGGEVASAHWEERKEAIRYDDDKDYPMGIVAENGAVKLHNVDCANVKPYGFNCRDGRITVTQGVQWPFTLLAIETDMALEMEGQNG